MASAIATPAHLIDALFFGGDLALRTKAWVRLVQCARRISPEEAEDLAQAFAQRLLERATALRQAQTITTWSGLEQALRQHRERLRKEASGVDEHPSPEREQLREALRKSLKEPHFRREVDLNGVRRYHLGHFPGRPPDPADLSLTFDNRPSDSDLRARTLVPRDRLVHFATAFLYGNADGATLTQLVDAVAEAGGYPFPGAFWSRRTWI